MCYHCRRLGGAIWGIPAKAARAALLSRQQHAGGLEEVSPDHGITAFGDPTAPIDLARGIAARRQSDIGADRARQDAPEMCTILGASVTIDPGSGLVQLGGLQRDPGAALPHRCH